MSQDLSHYDFIFLDFIQSELRTSFGDFIMPYITMLGNNGLIWILIASGLVIFRKHRLTGIKIFVALLLSLLIGNLLLKPMIGRIRPCDINTAITLLIPRPHDYSFPSGHTMSSFAAAAVLFLTGKRFGIPALILASFISFSRLYLYVHFPTDIAAGVVIGIVLAFVSVKIVDSINNYFNRSGRNKL